MTTEKLLPCCGERSGLGEMLIFLDGKTVLRKMHLVRKEKKCEEEKHSAIAACLSNLVLQKIDIFSLLW